jgi:hypothetical protein
MVQWTLKTRNSKPNSNLQSVDLSIVLRQRVLHKKFKIKFKFNIYGLSYIVETGLIMHIITAALVNAAV